MKGDWVKSKSGRWYRYYYQPKPKTNKPEKTVWLISRYGGRYRGYPRKGVQNPLKNCLMRDNYSCQICGVTINEKKLVVHHKDNQGYGITYKPNNDLANLITLCDKCHQRLHSGFFQRLHIIKELREKGVTLEEIGRLSGVSRQRIHQLLHKCA